MHYYEKYKIGVQKGFVGVIFLAIALIGIIIASIASMSRSNVSNTASESDKTAASTLMKQSADFKTGFDRLLIDPGLDPSNITFDDASSTGLFSPAFNLATRAIPPAGSLDPSKLGTTFTYNRKVLIPGIGSSTLYDFVVTLGGIQLGVCRALNHLLYNDSISNSPASSTAGFTAWSNISAETSIDDSSNTSLNYFGRPEGCIASSDGYYVYYKVLAEDKTLSVAASSGTGSTGSTGITSPDVSTTCTGGPLVCNGTAQGGPTHAPPLE